MIEQPIRQYQSVYTRSMHVRASLHNVSARLGPRSSSTGQAGTSSKPASAHQCFHASGSSRSLLQRTPN